MLNPALLFGLLAAGLPLVIHLFHRRKFQQVEWGAMHLLERVARKNNRRLRLQELILLLIRILIPAILALAMARPFLSGMEGLLGNARRSVVLLVDNSLSMAAGSATQTRLDKAKEAADGVVDRLRRGSDVVLATTGGGAVEAQPTTVNLPGVKEDLQLVLNGGGVNDPGVALQQAAAVASGMGQGAREIVYISDFQKRDWGSETAPNRLRAMEEIAASEAPPSLTFFKVEQDLRKNVAVTSLRASKSIVGVEQPFLVRTTVANFGEETARNVRVFFRADGVEKEVREIDLPGGGAEDLVFTHEFAGAGSHWLEIFADSPDLELDNHRRIVVPVWDKIPVLIVDGDPSDAPLENEAGFLNFALQPFSAEQDGLSNLIEAEVVERNQLNADLLEGKKALVLANVSRLSEPQLEAVSGFVGMGGGLLIFPGDQIDTRWYNSRLLKDDTALLPHRFADLQDKGGAGTEASIQSEFFDHPAMEFFNDPQNGNPAEVRADTWYVLAAPEDAPPDPEKRPRVLASLSTGAPLAVEKRYGEGRVIQVAIPVDAAWSNWPMRPVYLPMMQQWVTYLASTVFPPRNVEVGETLTAFYPPEVAGKRVFFGTPDGRRIETTVVSRGERASANFAGTGVPGIHILDRTGDAPLHYAVNPPPEESDVTTLPMDELETVAQEMGASVVDDLESYAELENLRRFGRELWRPLLGLLLGLLFTEVILEQLFGKRKTAL